MTEKELIGKIQELRQIQPRKDWVLLAKKDILGEEPVERTKVSWLEVFPRMFFQYKLAFATLALIMVLSTTFSFAQNALPGDLLFSLKKITEKTGAIFVSREEQPKAQLELANERLEELTKIAETNQVRKLAPAIEEYQASISQAAKATSQITKPQEVKKIAPEIKKMEEGIQNLRSYGVEIDDSEKEDLYKPIVEVLLKDLEDKTLTEDQKTILAEAKESYNLGDYSNALLILMEIQSGI
jgi:soluble cytochrome b562